MAYTFKKFDKNDYADVTQAEKKAAEYDTYARSDEVSSLFDKKNTYEANNNPGEWDADANGWQELLKAQDAALNRKAFSYDLNGDALYQQYKDKFINQGRLAMADTIGQASAMTGGYGSSYAVTAGNQAYQSHLQNLNDIVPQLYQMALDKYNQEGQDLKDAYSMLNNTYQTKYGEHMDKTNIYNTTLDRLTSEAYNAQNFDYGQWSDNRTFYNTLADNLYTRAFNEHNTNETNAFNAYNQLLNEVQVAASIGDTSKLKELGYDTSNMSTGGGGGGGVDPMSPSEWAAVRTNALSYYESGGKDALINYLEGLEARGYLTAEETNALLDEIAPVTPPKKGSGGGGESSYVFTTGGGKFAVNTKN